MSTEAIPDAPTVARVWAHPDGARILFSLPTISGEKFKAIAEDLRASIGARWDPSRLAWSLRPTATTRKKLQERLGRYVATATATAMLLHAETSWSGVVAKADEYPSDLLPIFAIPPRQYQCHAAAHMMACHNSWALLMDMGTGKTMTLMMWAAWAARDHGLRRMLLLCPHPIMCNEKAEFDKICPGGFAVTVLTGSGARKAKWLRDAPADGSGRPVVAVFNYDALISVEVERAARAFVSAEPGAVVCDESTRIKNGQAARSKAAWRIGKVAKWRGIMTGSPIADSPLDAFGQWRFLDETAFGTSYVAFRNRYCVMGGYGGYEVVSYRNMDEFKKILLAKSFRVEKADCLDLPPKTFVRRTFKMPESMARVYTEMARDLVAEFEGREWEATIILTKLMRLQEITSGYLKEGDRVAALPSNPKADLLADVLAETSAEKVVVWCREVEELRWAVEVVRASGRKVWELSGETPNKQEVVQGFQEAEGLTCLVAQQNTGRFGFTMCQASLAVYISNFFSRETRTQSEDRLHRSGQTRAVTYVDLVAEGTVDEYVLDVLSGKAKTSDALLRIRESISGAMPLRARDEI
mgnify:CR=1 FL=1